MKLSCITILILASLGIAVSTPLRGVGDRRLDVVMTGDDFDKLEVVYDARDDTCEFTFKVKGENEKTIKANDQIEVADDGHKVVCREYVGATNGVELEAQARFDLGDVKWIDENGNELTVTGAKFRWFKQGDGRTKLKISIFKNPDAGGDPDPSCDHPHENKWRGGCELAQNDRRQSRPTDGSDYFEDTYVVNCPSGQPEPVYWIVGTSEDSCKRDKICDCHVNDRQITCTVLLYKEDSNEDCDDSNVNIALHALCC